MTGRVYVTFAAKENLNRYRVYFTDQSHSLFYREVEAADEMTAWGAAVQQEMDDGNNERLVYKWTERV